MNRRDFLTGAVTATAGTLVGAAATTVATQPPKALARGGYYDMKSERGAALGRLPDPMKFHYSTFIRNKYLTEDHRAELARRYPLLGSGVEGEPGWSEDIHEGAWRFYLNGVELDEERGGYVMRFDVRAGFIDILENEDRVEKRHYGWIVAERRFEP